MSWVPFSAAQIARVALPRLGSSASSPSPPLQGAPCLRGSIGPVRWTLAVWLLPAEAPGFQGNC